MATTLTVPPVDYTSRDFESLRADMINAIPFFAPEYTDNNPSDFGIALIELLAYMGDNIHFYIDRMAAESFLPTAITLQSVKNLLTLIDYQMSGPVASTVTLQFYTTTPPALPILIKAGTLVQTLPDAGSNTGAIPFETLSDTTIPAGYVYNPAVVNGPGSTGAVQGKTATPTSPGPYVDLGSSNGLANQTFTITDTPIIEGSLGIYVNEGIGLELWAIVDSFIDSGPNSKVCTLSSDSNNYTIVHFGDNGQGKIPNPTADVQANYRLGGGAVGNVGANTITVLVSTGTVTAGGNPITVAVTNPSAATGGADAESIETAKLKGPRSLSALNRAVVQDDYSALADTVSGVAKSYVLAGHFSGSNKTAPVPANVFIVPNGGGQPTETLMEEVAAFLSSKNPAGTTVEVFGPTYSPIDVKGTVVAYSNFDLNTVQSNVTAQIAAYFDAINSPYTTFATSANLSDFLCTLTAVSGVDHVNLTDFTRQPSPVYTRWNGGTTFDQSSFVVGAASVDEIWTVNFTTPSNLLQYTVTGSISGFQGYGIVGVPFLSNNGNLAMNLLGNTSNAGTCNTAIGSPIINWYSGNLFTGMGGQEIVIGGSYYRIQPTGVSIDGKTATLTSTVSATLTHSAFYAFPLNSLGDISQFRTSSKLNNVNMGPTEFFSQGLTSLNYTVSGTGDTVKCT
jgi:hypothetical protein